MQQQLELHRVHVHVSVEEVAHGVVELVLEGHQLLAQLLVSLLAEPYEDGRGALARTCAERLVGDVELHAGQWG